MVRDRRPDARRGPRGRPGKAGPVGRTGKTGAKGETGAKGPAGHWPTEAFDLLQSRIDELRRDLSFLIARFDELTETLAQSGHLQKRF